MMPTLRRPGVLPYLMTAPAHILLALFILLPAVYVFALSFMQSSYGQDASFAGLENYAKILGDRYFWASAWNTFIVVNAVVYIELALALGLTLLLPPPGALTRIIVSIILLPYAVSEVVGVLMIKYMFDPGAGAIAYWLQALGVPELQWTTQPGHALVLVILLSVWLHTPFTFLIVYTARLGLPAELYEAARTDGANAWQRFCHVTLPLLMPAILVAVVFRYIFAFRIFPEVWLLTQGGPARQTEVLAVYLYKSAFRYYDYGMASATAWAMVVLSLLIAAAYLRSMYRRMFIHAH
ncbi:MAG: sugar ABC transporter permease [Pseudomonadota bacterium]